jgi:cysteinyl-tRNA synthetase
MTDIRLYNTLSKKVEPVTVPADGPLRLYTCGPTVYNYQHIGNYRTYIFEDVLKRTLRYLGYPVRHVMNITDVGHLTDDGDEGEDKLEVGAKREGKTAWEIAREYEEAFLKDIAKLDIDFKPAEKPAREAGSEAIDILCRATEHIEEQQALVDQLSDKGMTYETEDGIYFDTSKFAGYGKMAGAAHIAGLKEGSRVQMGEKKHLTDFALWKFSPKGEERHMEWEYRGRKGFPGWHIECSAMGMAYLGESFDIHCGGVDHIPIHHSNEIAQAEAATGKTFVKVWMHGEFLVMNKAKMAKSAGGFIRLVDLEEKGISAFDYRYFCYGAHYRKQLDFSWEGLESAKTARRRLKDKVQALIDSGASADESTEECDKWIHRFRECVANDLNMPEALAAIYDAMSGLAGAPDKLRFLKETEKVMALGLFEKEAAQELPSELQEKFDGYVNARKGKDWATSDRLRAELKDAGIQVLDSKDGSRWRRL